MPFTHEQEAYIEAYKQGDASIAMDAVAGSGKTTTLVAGAKASQPHSAIALAFNAKNAKDLSAKMPEFVECRTFNSLGHRAWMRQLPNVKLALEDRKTFKLMDEVVAKEVRYELKDFSKLISQLRMNLLVPEGAVGAGQFCRPNLSEPMIADIVEDLDLDMGRVEPQLYSRWAAEVLRRSIATGWKGSIDFDDQIYLPLIYGSKLGSPQTAIVDEMQDLNPAQHLMVERLKSKRIVGAGDPRQAIYAFRGALADSMPAMIDRFDLKRMQLSVCFRCAKSIVREAKKLVPHIEYFEGSPEGEVIDIDDYLDAQPGDAIISRYNKHLIRAALRLIAQRKPVSLKGRNIVASIAKALKPLPDSLVDAELTAAVVEIHDSEVIKLLAEQKDTKAETVRDRKEAICELIRGGGKGTNKERILQLLATMTQEYGGKAIELMTIHGAKGLEYPTVWFLFPEELPPSRRNMSPEDRQQEYNLIYVATTRAMLKLYYVHKSKKTDPED